MKKVLLTLFTISLCIVGTAQITLEKTFTNAGGPTNPFVTDSGIKYAHTNTTTNKVTIYNSDFSIYKTISFSLSANEEMGAAYHLSDKLFNSDSQIEFIIVITNSTAGTQSMKAYNENKQVIKDFGDRSYAHVFHHNGVTKLNVTKLTYNSTTSEYIYKNEIYSLPGYILSLPNNENDPTLNAYPNPSNSVINLPYQLTQGQSATMNIYNASGQLVATKEIDSSFDKIKLDVSTYKAGIYFYVYNGITKKFVVE
jgi:hypothetical protein